MQYEEGVKILLLSTSLVKNYSLFACWLFRQIKALTLNMNRQKLIVNFVWLHIGFYKKKYWKRTMKTSTYCRCWLLFLESRACCKEIMLFLDPCGSWVNEVNNWLIIVRAVERHLCWQSFVIIMFALFLLFADVSGMGLTLCNSHWMRQCSCTANNRKGYTGLTKRWYRQKRHIFSSIIFKVTKEIELDRRRHLFITKSFLYGDLSEMCRC